MDQNRAQGCLSDDYVKQKYAVIFHKYYTYLVQLDTGTHIRRIDNVRFAHLWNEIPICQRSAFLVTIRLFLFANELSFSFQVDSILPKKLGWFDFSVTVLSPPNSLAFTS